jgi:hypothetical protein
MKTLVALMACCVASTAMAQAPKADMTGIWRRVGTTPNVVVDGGGQPRLTADGAKQYAANRAAAARGDYSHDTSKICLPDGIPRLMLKGQPFEILQRPTIVAFNYQINRLPRVVYLDAKPPIENGGYYLGESTGKWEGDALVIDTRGFNTDTLIDDAGLPHSEDMTVTERLKLSADGKKLVNQITVVDPAIFRSPWTTTVNYARQSSPIVEDVCAERIGSSKPKRKR